MFKGEILRELRLKNEKRQEDVAKYCNITPGSYAHFEAGRRQPKHELVKKLAEYFNIDERVFYGEEIQIDKVRELIDSLIENKIIKDPDNIPDDVVKLIMDAVKMEVRMLKIKEQGE